MGGQAHLGAPWRSGAAFWKVPPASRLLLLCFPSPEVPSVWTSVPGELVAVARDVQETEASRQSLDLRSAPPPPPRGGQR